MAAGLGSTWWQYLVLFVAVAASWAGVPFIGTAALGAAAVAASQRRLDLAAVIVVATVAGEAGGIGGYAIGRRWGRQLLERPGRHRARREKIWRHTGFVDNYIMPLAPFSCQFRVHTRRASDTPVPSESSDDCSTLPRTRTKPASHARRSSMHAGG